MAIKNTNLEPDVLRFYGRFEEIKEGQIISSARSLKDGTVEHFTFTAKDRDWSMAWSNESLARSQLPKYWFVSTEGDVISVLGKYPKYIRKDTKNKRGYIKYHFYIGKNKKCISGHALTAIVFKSTVMPDAQKSLDEKGLYSFGKRNDQNQTHHSETGNLLDCNPKKQCICTACDHRLIHAQRWPELVQEAQRQADMSGQAIIITPPYNVDAGGNPTKYNAKFDYRLISKEDTQNLMQWISEHMRFVPIHIDTGTIKDQSGIENLQEIIIQVFQNREDIDEKEIR